VEFIEMDDLGKQSLRKVEGKEKQDPKSRLGSPMEVFLDNSKINQVAFSK
jgi:hypothetical protein